MRNDQTAVTRGKNSTSNLKKKIGKADNDQGWKDEDLKKAEVKAKAARAPGAGKDRESGLSVPARKS
jgi:hypothetical protein